ncbi:MAG: hypothetical protein AB7E52_07615 [Bdellovibrionales bacterium]
MRTEIGEYIVGAYLKLVLGCDVVDYNVRIPGGKLEGLGELDVVGYNFELGHAFICEVATHILGLDYGGYDETLDRIRRKHERQKIYAERFLKGRFNEIRFMFWSPNVPVGKLTTGLAAIEGMDLILNAAYKKAVGELKTQAQTTSHDTGNPFFRALQILQHLRD